MNSALQIRFFHRHQLSIERWDRCIAQCDQPLIYAQSWVLDTLCDRWGALVLNDYEAVMPLPWRRKWGINYVYQPAFIQRLAVFGKKVDSQLATLFFDACFKKFTFVHACFNQAPENGYSSQQVHTNLLIHLSKGYNAIQSLYTPQCTKNLRQALARGCQLIKNVPVETVISMYRKAYGHLNEHATDASFQRLMILAEEGIKRKQANTYGVTDASGTLVYSALIFNDTHRLYYLLGAPSKAGRQLKATYFFIDQLLRQYAGTPLLFDFEGSDLPDVAAFYRRFGPSKEYYYTIKANHLPRWLQWLKH